MDDRADVDYDAVYGERLRAGISHYLAVEKHGEYPHRGVDKKGREAGDKYPPQLCRQFYRPYQPQRVVF
ncbi:hypothetical protein SDC9_125803 [bioreactor metagenome]|uniref:Uncharacterized protein n=1 Tax=bioreactor metagenome TaxID=1076179 RepID=A0A645CNZ5_9ZZZZ